MNNSFSDQEDSIIDLSLEMLAEKKSFISRKGTSNMSQVACSQNAIAESSEEDDSDTCREDNGKIDCSNSSTEETDVLNSCNEGQKSKHAGKPSVSSFMQYRPEKIISIESDSDNDSEPIVLRNSSRMKSKPVVIDSGDSDNENSVSPLSHISLQHSKESSEKISVAAAIEDRSSPETFMTASTIKSNPHVIEVDADDSDAENNVSFLSHTSSQHYKASSERISIASAVEDRSLPENIMSASRMESKSVVIISDDSGAENKGTLVSSPSQHSEAVPMTEVATSPEEFTTALSPSQNLESYKKDKDQSKAMGIQRNSALSVTSSDYKIDSVDSGSVSRVEEKTPSFLPGTVSESAINSSTRSLQRLLITDNVADQEHRKAKQNVGNLTNQSDWFRKPNFSNAVPPILKPQPISKVLPPTGEEILRPPLKMSSQSHEYSNMASIAELHMLENQIIAKKRELKTNNDILARINLEHLPDKGKKVQARSLDLEKKVKELEQYRARFQSQTGSFQTIPPQEVKPQPPTWKEIRRTGDVQHGMGVKAMENYYAERAATLEVLKRLHQSLKSRPEASELADDPRGLRSSVSLMTHQRHALAWMMWREREEPPGGILADDMGLGKTLTMISLVLKCAEDNINWHLDSDDENEQPKSSRKSTKGGTLVVCPASLLNQWAGEVKSRVKTATLDVEVHHGPGRESRPHRLARKDIVVTTYAIVMSEHHRMGPVHQVRWQRVILDEAHAIRNHKCQTTLAVLNLKAHCRWALTGTPIHNKEMDVFSLLKFLRCSPFDELPMWKKWVDNRSEGGMIRLNTVMNTIMLRRTKEQLNNENALMGLPDRMEEVIPVKLDPQEAAVYEKVLIFSRNLMIEFLHQKAEKEAGLKGLAYTPLNLNQVDPSENPFGGNSHLGDLHKRMTAQQNVKSHHILVLLLRLRQVCCHPGLIKKMLDDDTMDSAGIEDKDGLDVDLLDQMNRMSLSERDKQDLNPDEALEDEDVLKASNPVFDTENASSKMLAVFECLKKNVLDSGDKAVVVSQWPSVLILMRSHLKAMGLKNAMLTGAVPVKDRSIIVDRFNQEGRGPRVLLLSLTAGGVGLNLVGGNHLLLCDLHWNPQLESQACDRIYRIGQKKPVRIYKFICEDTIEQKIQTIQQKKLDIATNVLTGARHAQASKLTIEDLKTIFNL